MNGMKYQIGDIVAFDVPKRAPQGELDRNPSGGSSSQRFHLGVVKAFDPEHQSYLVVGLHGGNFTIPESELGGSTG